MRRRKLRRADLAISYEALREFLHLPDDVEILFGKADNETGEFRLVVASPRLVRETAEGCHPPLFRGPAWLDTPGALHPDPLLLFDDSVKQLPVSG